MVSIINVEGNIKENYRTEIECSHRFILDQPPAAGGSGEGPNPLELLLSSVAGCFCAIGRIIANQRQLKVDGIHVVVKGHINKSYLLGQTSDGRAGFAEITSYVSVDADMNLEEKQKFVEEIERRCPVADNLSNKTVLKTLVVHEKTPLSVEME
jgi:uncharacterized OsmC-like protein